MSELNPSLFNPDRNKPKHAENWVSNETVYEESMRVIGENAASIVHELRNPLLSIKAYLQLLELRLEQQITDDSVPRFEVLYSQIEHMHSMLNQFLSLARFAEAELRPVDLAAQMEEYIPFLRCIAVSHSVAMETAIAETAPLCMCDISQIRRLILNLFLNARDAVLDRPAPKIRVALGVQDDELVLDVIDNGCGIPVEVQDDIWLLNFTTKPTGTGYGLPCCTKIAADHHGRLTLESTPGVGSRFRLHLPILG